MQVKGLQRELSSALIITNKAVDSNSTLPVLNNVLLKAEGKQLKLTATNLEMAIEYALEVQVLQEGEITLPSKLFTQYVGFLNSGDEVELSTEAETALIQTQDSKTTLKGISPSEFPPIPAVEKSGSLSISVFNFKRAINQVVFSAAVNTTRPILAGVYFHIEEAQLKLATTDSYRLSEKKLSIHNLEGEVEAIVPARALIDLSAILEVLPVKEESVLNLTFSKNQVSFEFSTFRLTSRLIEGQFPNYQQILPKTHRSEIKFEKTPFILGLKRVNLFARQNNNKVILEFKGQTLLIRTEGTQYGQGQVEVPCLLSGEENQIALNSQYILDLLSGAIEGKILLELDEKTTPAVFKSEKSDQYLHLIMPLKL